MAIARAPTANGSCAPATAFLHQGSHVQEQLHELGRGGDEVEVVGLDMVEQPELGVGLEPADALQGRRQPPDSTIGT